MSSIAWICLVNNFIRFDAFTLVEMILVIILIGILAGVALPKFLDLKKEALIASYTQDKMLIESGLEQLLMKWRVSGGRPHPGNMDHNRILKIGDKSVKYTHYGWPIRIANVGDSLDVDVYHNSSDNDGYICADIFRYLLGSDDAVEHPCNYNQLGDSRYCAQLAPDEFYVPGFAFCTLFPKDNDCMLPVMTINYEMDLAKFTYTGVGVNAGAAHRTCSEAQQSPHF